MKKKKKGVGYGVLLLLLGLVVFVRMGLRNDLVVREYTISSDQITEPHTFAVLADLHCTEYGEEQSLLIEAIGRAAPDAVFLVGDIGDDKRSMTPCDTLLTALDYPCFYVTGNHERWCEAATDMKEYFRALGAVPLSGSSVDLTLGGDTIRIHGVDDPLFYEDTEAFRAALAGLAPSEEGFDILLSHRPEFAEEYAALGFELSLNGHAHGGQVRIPGLLNGLYAPGQQWCPEYAGGRYTFDGGEVIVSRGLMLDDKPRFYNPPELVIVHLVPEVST